MNHQRRTLLKTGAAVAAAISLPASSYARVLGINEQLRGAVIGLNGRGKNHLQGHGDQIVAICDCDTKVMDQQYDAWIKKPTKSGATRSLAKYQDYRKLLEDSSIDFVSIATPNHQHSIMGIEAAMAGKHVYVEKPVSHNVWEGRQLSNAQAKYNVVIQCGTQSRSSPSLQAAVKFVRDGGIGKLQYAVGTCYKPRKSIGKLDAPLSLPSHIDYDLWCGPAEKRSLFRSRLHYDWHWDFNTGNGDMGNQGIHQMDIARWFLGYDTVSPRVFSVGGRVGYEDAGDTPNTQTVIHDYPEAPLIFETRGLPAAKQFQGKGWGQNMDNYRGSRIGVIVQGASGYVVIPNYTSVTAFDDDGNEIQKFKGGGDHYANFRDAVEAGDQSKLNAPIVEGHLSSALCHTGGVSHQLGESMSAKEVLQSVSRESEWFRDSVKRMLDHLKANEVDVENGDGLVLGASLKCDPKTEQVTNHEKGNTMMSREYRKGFVVPEVNV
ncbi:MAG: Gfo/Idh/MocA family oxidoreductase [Planctomycetota bacterium]